MPITMKKCGYINMNKDSCTYCEDVKEFSDMELFTDISDDKMCDSCLEIKEICKDMWITRLERKRIDIY
jgi:hypothetical protein